MMNKYVSRMCLAFFFVLFAFGGVGCSSLFTEPEMSTMLIVDIYDIAYMREDVEGVKLIGSYRNASPESFNRKPCEVVLDQVKWGDDSLVITIQCKPVEQRTEHLFVIRDLNAPPHIADDFQVFCKCNGKTMQIREINSIEEVRLPAEVLIERCDGDDFKIFL